MKSMLWLATLLFVLASCNQKNRKPGSEQIKQTEQDTASANDGLAVAEDTVASEVPLSLPPADEKPLKLIAQKVQLTDDSFSLWLPKGFQVYVAASGMRKIRFMDMSPDGRLFIPDMQEVWDNSEGNVYILSRWNEQEKRFEEKSTWTDKLRNPNSLAFYADKEGNEWIYLALTDKLIRYHYQPGELEPTGEPQLIATFPDYGKDYRKGGWHLTRTICFGDNGKLYVSIGSSCNACLEKKDELRAMVLEMNPDGSAQKVYAKGLRNAVGLSWAGNHLFTTVMGVDHLGMDKPQDVAYVLQRGMNYGWPYCYPMQDGSLSDSLYNKKDSFPCGNIPKPFAAFGPHAAPLGIAYFPPLHVKAPELEGYFLVALHGPYSPYKGRGYMLVRMSPAGKTEPFMTGFLEGKNNVHGRPCGVFPLKGKDAFFLSDDKKGVLYYVVREGK